jgi:hypothetical protein
LCYNIRQSLLALLAAALLAPAALAADRFVVVEHVAALG